jgi:hypothetical protein
MVHTEAFAEWGLFVVVYTEPFAVEDMLSAATSFRAIAGPATHLRCVPIDLRKVAVRGVTASDSRRLANFRKEGADGQLAEPAAFVIRRMEDFPYVRMHNQWVDAVGLRKAKDTLITTDIHEALNWLEEKTGQSGLASSMGRPMSA